MAPELKNSFFLLCDVIITVVVLGPKTRWSIKISFPTVAMVVSPLVIFRRSLAQVTPLPLKKKSI